MSRRYRKEYPGYILFFLLIVIIVVFSVLGYLTTYGSPQATPTSPATTTGTQSSTPSVPTNTSTQTGTLPTNVTTQG
ncbi:MAG: hypothetical protein B6U85_08550 [Desulfurococcales archaeon ex4484_42]|nr:MAG: hypothetical protein B6U85_08550 [Desulfurococcales archaeon ex4484_42]